MRKIYTYKVYHGWAFPEFKAEFKSFKKAIEYIKSQECPDDWCFDKVLRGVLDE